MSREEQIAKFRLLMHQFEDAIILGVYAYVGIGDSRIPDVVDRSRKAKKALMDDIERLIPFDAQP